MRTFIPRALSLLAVGAAAAAAFAAEGSIPVRAGDVVRGTLARCGDRHVFETDLARGDTLRVRVTLPDPTTPPTLGVETVDGTNVTYRARVVGGGGVVTAGPFRAPESGVYRVTLTSSAAGAIAYQMTSSVRRIPRRDVRLPANGRATSVLVEAGARFRLRTRDGVAPRLTVGFPGETPRELAADDPFLAALSGAGLTAPTSGSYTFAVASTRGARIAVAAPTYVAHATIDFPALPGADSMTTWYPASGWVDTPGASAPSGHDPTSGPVVEETPVPVELSTPLTQVVAAPAPTPAMDDASTWLGPSAGVGMPLAGAPSLAEVFASGGAPSAANGFAYQVNATRPGFGDVSYRVRFSVDGRPSPAPLSLTGRVTMSWSVTSAAAYHDGGWTLTFDSVRGVQVLDGNETLTDGAGRTTSVASRGFAASSGASNWPSGALTWRFDDPRNGTSFARRETYDGTSTVGVNATTSTR